MQKYAQVQTFISTCARVYNLILAQKNGEPQRQQIEGGRPREEARERWPIQAESSREAAAVLCAFL